MLGRIELKGVAVKATLSQVLSETFEYLRTLSRNNLRPEEAQVHLRSLQQRYPGTRIQLLWEEVAYDQSVHYDALLHLDGEGTISLSFCADHGIPWPMRGAHRWGEKDLVRVNDTVLQVDQALACLEFIWDEVRLINRLIDVCLIREVLESDPIELSDEDLQQAMDAFRRVHALYRAEDTHQWLRRRGMTHDQLEHLVAEKATIAKLREQVAAQSVQDYFEAHRASFDRACIACIPFSNKEDALRIAERLRGSDCDFYEAAQRCFLTTAHSARWTQNLFTVVQRGHWPSELVDSVFFAAPGDVLGPLQSGEANLIVRVLAFTSAQLDESTRCTIKDILFEDWLAKRRQEATVEWYWGNRSRTTSQVSALDHPSTV